MISLSTAERFTFTFLVLDKHVVRRLNIAAFGGVDAVASSQSSPTVTMPSAIAGGRIRKSASAQANVARSS
jgi:hypothetical protein